MSLSMEQFNTARESLLNSATNYATTIAISLAAAFGTGCAINSEQQTPEECLINAAAAPMDLYGTPRLDLYFLGKWANQDLCGSSEKTNKIPTAEPL